jgi:predicted house-cleaning NTP pyrophosphatase (Maf/HAM1 superfamily)
LKNAAAWCSFDKRMLIKQAKRLHELDQMIFSMDTEIQIHSKLMKKSKDEESTLIYLSKLTNNKAKKRSFMNEINDFILDYQRWQTKMFNTKPSY